MSGLSERLREVYNELERSPEPIGLYPEIAEAASLIDQYEKALEAADELAKVAAFAPVTRTARVVYRSARSTSTKEDG